MRRLIRNRRIRADMILFLHIQPYDKESKVKLSRERLPPLTRFFFAYLRSQNTIRVTMASIIYGIIVSFNDEC